MPQEPARKLNLSPDQQKVFDQIAAWLRKPKSQVMTLGGYAGTGKSTLISQLASQRSNEHFIAFCAFTGKAANGLKQKLTAAGVDLNRHTCSTIHSLLYVPKVHPTTGRIVGWKRRPQIDASLIIVDEASMVPEDIFRDLKSYGLPILAVGDHGQLPPVRSNFSLMQKPQLRLEQIHRQAESNPIIRLSKVIRETGKLDRSLEDGNHIRFLGYDRAMETLKERFADKLGKELFDVAVLAYTNKTRCALNNRIRKIRYGENPGGPKVGEQIICLKNARVGPEESISVFNGMRGILEHLEPKKDGHTTKADVAFPEDNIDIYEEINSYQFGREKTFSSLEEFEPFKFSPGIWREAGLLFDYGYTMTVHKAQGSGFDDVVLFYEKPGFVDEDDYRRWIYTAITRSSNKLTIIGAP